MNSHVSSDIKIVPFTPDHAKDVKRVVMNVLEWVGIPSDPTTADRDEDLDNITTLYTGRAKFWIALDKDEVIGTVAVEEKDQKIAWLRRMFVLPAYHGTGIAEKLLTHALSFATHQRYTHMELQTHHKMKRAHAFYEHHGFQKIGKTDEGFLYLKQL